MGRTLSIWTKKYINSIRDVIRFTNVLLLKYELLKDETDPVDLLGLTCLQVFEPSVYSKLPKYKEILCGGNYSYSYGRQKEDEEDYAHRDFLINNKIAVSECFDRYFALVLENDAISTAMIKRLIYDSNETDFSEGIMQLYQEGKIIRLLEEIEAYANSGNLTVISEERASLIIKNLARNWSCFEVDDRGFFSMPFAWRLLFCVNPLLKTMDSVSRLSCIYAVFEDKNVQPSTLALLLNNFETQHGRFTEKTSSRDDTIFPLEEVLNLERIFKNRSVEVLDSVDALRQCQCLDFLWMLGKIDAELVANKKKSITTDNISLIKIISYCTSRGTVATRTVSKMRNVNRNAIGDFIDIDEAYRRVKAFAATSQFFQLTKDDQMNAIAFICITEQTDCESISENGIAEDAIISMLAHLANQTPTD